MGESIHRVKKTADSIFSLQKDPFEVLVEPQVSYGSKLLK